MEVNNTPFIILNGNEELVKTPFTDVIYENGSFDDYLETGAVFSTDRQYRYLLSRVWDYNNNGMVNFLCLNPSTATHLQNDPTIRRCIGYAKEWGYSGLYITNIFAYRATLPKDMRAQKDPVGIYNDSWLLYAHNRSEKTIAAWGTHGEFMCRAEHVKNLIRPLHCLKITKEGFPSHPLYLKADLKPTLYSGF